MIYLWWPKTNTGNEQYLVLQREKREMWHIGRNIWAFFHTEYFKIIHVVLSALLCCPAQSKATHFWSVPVWKQMALAKQWLCGQLSMGHTQDHCLAERSVCGQVWASWGVGGTRGITVKTIKVMMSFSHCWWTWPKSSILPSSASLSNLSAVFSAEQLY